MTALRPHAPPGMVCPLHRKDMSKVCHKCPLWTQLRGTHPQNGSEVDEWACSLSWLPMLLIENAKEVRQGAAATESFRNEMVQGTQLLLDAARERSQERVQLLEVMHPPNT
jgi:hypothetical protein